MGCEKNQVCFEALFGVSLGGSGVSIGGVRILRVGKSFWYAGMPVQKWLSEEISSIS